MDRQNRDPVKASQKPVWAEGGGLPKLRPPGRGVLDLGPSGEMGFPGGVRIHDHIVHRPMLHNATGVHDGDALGHLGNHCQIMGDNIR